MKEQHKYFITPSLYHVNNCRASIILWSCLIFVFLLSALFGKGDTEFIPVPPFQEERKKKFLEIYPMIIIAHENY